MESAHQRRAVPAMPRANLQRLLWAFAVPIGKSMDNYVAPGPKLVTVSESVLSVFEALMVWCLGQIYEVSCQCIFNQVSKVSIQI